MPTSSTAEAKAATAGSETGPSQIALDEWAALGLRLPDLTAMRAYRRERIIAEIANRNLAGLLCFDPINIRYITDSSNMQVWTTHTPSRAVFVSASGYIILWDFEGCAHLSVHLPLIDEVRSSAGALYFDHGESMHEVAGDFAREVRDVLTQKSGSNRKLAVDRADTAVLIALQQIGLEIVEGQSVCEQARLIKSCDEIAAMKCAIAAASAATAEMHDQLRPGMSENELWSHLHAGSIKRGGEWIETRLLSSGARTNPWYQECGAKIIEDGDLVAFDTDLIGNYGMCVDFSRTWLAGDGPVNSSKVELHQHARDHLEHNIALMQPGMSFAEITAKSHRLPDRFQAQRYAMLAHGVGLCDEFPCIAYPEDDGSNVCVGALAPGMVLSVEAYIGETGGAEGVKLEDMILVTETGNELLTNYPFDERLDAG